MYKHKHMCVLCVPFCLDQKEMSCTIFDMHIGKKILITGL